MNDLVNQDLPFRVFLRTEDGRWTLKAAFASLRLAGAYVIGLKAGKVDARIFPRDLSAEVTAAAIQEAQTAMHGK